MNVLWLLFSVVLLGVATAVARESRQRRQSVRITKAVPSDILLPDGYMAQGITCNLSNGGVQARIHGPVHAGVGDPVRFVFPLLDGTATLPATVVSIEEEMLRAKFNSLNLQETEALAMILYSRADTWLGPREAREADHPMRSLGRILRLSLYGLSQTAGSLLGNPWRRNKRSAAKGGLAASVVPVLLFAVLAGVSTRDARGAQAADADFQAAIVESSQSPAISQTVSALRGTRFSTYRIGTGCYLVGKIPLLARATMVLTEFPWLIVLVVAIFCFPMAMVIWAMVRRHARARLQGSD
jgi:cellulose synthase (UDP-forming)